MICNKCNQNVDNEVSFCPKCGNDLRSMKATPQPSKSSIFDVFKGKQFKSELEQTRAELEQARQLLTPEMKNVILLENKANEIRSAIQQLEGIISTKQSIIQGIARQEEQIRQEIAQKKSQMIQLDNEILMQDFGLYKPMFSFATSEQYKSRLDAVREKQKDFIKAGKAYSIGNMTLNGSASAGQKITTSIAKLLLRAFNNESDDCVEKVKFNNIGSIEDRLVKSFQSINKTCEAINVFLVQDYLKFKIEELHLAHEYAMKKQDEKEEQRRQREELREQEKLAKEIAMQKEKLEKEEKHFLQALSALNAQLKTAEGLGVDAIRAKIEEINKQLGSLNENRQKLLYREQNTRAGYVYVISNIGAFGEGVYKIGVTRRLEPTERIDELGDASVPFEFDIHALIFSDDAPALETALHKAFADRKLNLVNERREFFKVSIDEIETVVKANHDRTIEFVKIPDAEQFRVSQKIREGTRQQQSA